MGRISMLRKIHIATTNDRLTQATGLGTMIESFHESPLAQPFYKSLPKRTSVRSLGHAKLGLIFLSSFLYGHDAIDDLEEFEGDDYLENFYRGNLPAPRTMGDFLRDFNFKNLGHLNAYLPFMAHRIRKQFVNRLPKEYKPGPLQLSIDSTPHVQHGVKMEGVEMNYEGKLCLDSQRISDQSGLTYGFQLRRGNMGKGVGARDLILQAFKGMSFREEKYLSGDSAYLNQDVVRACLSVGAWFTITAPDTIRWTEKVEGGDFKWQPWEYSEDEKAATAERGRDLPIVELSRYHWRPSWDKNNQLHIPIVIKRTWVSYESQVSKNKTGNLFSYSRSAEGYWDYYAVATSMPLIKFTKQQVIERHNQRGNCERFIREEKYGFDLLHFPCLKLDANYAYGLLAQVAHNILRWLAVLERPDKPHFSKKLRRRFIYIPGKLVSHARTLRLRVPKRFIKEVEQLQMALQWKPCPALATGGP